MTSESQFFLRVDLDQKFSMELGCIIAAEVINRGSMYRGQVHLSVIRRRAKGAGVPPHNHFLT
uniref:DNA-directed RNA polymerase n=1 Tax=Heterorhabditis bacteriophora TaxID=37862 RepID=A0A1I7XD51_HETBA